MSFSVFFMVSRKGMITFYNYREVKWTVCAISSEPTVKRPMLDFTSVPLNLCVFV